MNIQTGLPELLDFALQTTRFGVLATEGSGQPHVSLIAITPVKGFSQMVFATYRNTRKFRNLKSNGKVAVLLSGGDSEFPGLQYEWVVTAFGQAEEIVITPDQASLQSHLSRHPELMPFLKSADCALIMINVEKYQIVQGIDQVAWLSVEDLEEGVNQ
jgi:nitroimidazol reductase NimA-like FMN-containing flavoprotein (pyridoxamine 5'-phosphate oxidase superfamily)